MEKDDVTSSDDSPTVGVKDTLGELFSPEEIGELATKHGVDRKVVEVVSTMLRIIECRRLNIEP